jgi:hypothetical protein
LTVMMTKIFESSRRVGRQARDKLLGDRTRDTATNVFNSSQRIARQARSTLFGDRTRATATKAFDSGRRVGRQARDKHLPHLVNSTRRAIDRLVKRIRP